MNEAIRVDQFHRTTKGQRLLGLHSANLCKMKRQDGANPFSAGGDRIAHGLSYGIISPRILRKVFIQRMVDL